MTDKEKLLNVLNEIGVNVHEYNTDIANVVCTINENYDVEERSFSFHFDKITGKYFDITKPILQRENGRGRVLK